MPQQNEKQKSSRKKERKKEQGITYRRIKI